MLPRFYNIVCRLAEDTAQNKATKGRKLYKVVANNIFHDYLLSTAKPRSQNHANIQREKSDQVWYDLGGVMNINEIWITISKNLSLTIEVPAWHH